VQWATSAGNLATTLRDYALMSKDPAPIAEAADLLQQAISLTPRAQSPLDWAEFQTKLGNVWADAVSFDQKPETVDKAVAAYSAALEIQTPELNIGSWEQLHVYIVSALLSTAVEQKDVARLKQARATAAEASEVLKAHNLPDVALFDGWLGVLDQFIEALSKQVAPAS
jgi:hypothetical protein